MFISSYVLRLLYPIVSNVCMLRSLRYF